MNLCLVYICMVCVCTLYLFVQYTNRTAY
jgi:hypothetical protein